MRMNEPTVSQMAAELSKALHNVRHDLGGVEDVVYVDHDDALAVLSRRVQVIEEQMEALADALDYMERRAATWG